MKHYVRAVGLGLLAAVFTALPAMGDSLTETGVIALRSVTTNANGTGIRVAQVEAAGSAFEVNPAYVGQPTNLFTYISAAGMATNYPNSVGVKSDHAGDVGLNFYGITGGVATNLAHVDNFEVNYFIDYYVVSNLAVLNEAIVNQSYTYGALSVSDQQQVDSAFDDYAAATGILFVTAACNLDINTNVSAPGTAYNCISVGSYNGNSSIGPTIDNRRCKPDINAPFNGGATSFATPFVSGAAAILMQTALGGTLAGDTNSACDMRTLKALLLNGAVKPLNWTNANNSPLDARYGAGNLNALNSYKQLVAGEPHGRLATNIPVGSAHLPLVVTNTITHLKGWDFATNSTTMSQDSVAHYFFNVTNAAGSPALGATITLVWNRQLGKTGINNLDLFLYNAAGGLVAWSTSRVDNVEHIFVPQLPAGRYDVEVLKNGGGGTVSSAEAYALAWEFVAPTLQITKTGGTTTLTWPVYPAGFLVEARTNLVSGSWSSNGFVAFPTITNGQNSIQLNTTNAAQFFRLRKPNL